MLRRATGARAGLASTGSRPCCSPLPASPRFGRLLATAAQQRQHPHLHVVEHDGLAAHRLEGAHGGVDAAGQQVLRLLEDLQADEEQPRNGWWASGAAAPAGGGGGGGARPASDPLPAGPARPHPACWPPQGPIQPRSRPNGRRTSSLRLVFSLVAVAAARTATERRLRLPEAALTAGATATAALLDRANILAAGVLCGGTGRCYKPSRVREGGCRVPRAAPYAPHAGPSSLYRHAVSPPRPASPAIPSGSLPELAAGGLQGGDAAEQPLPPPPPTCRRLRRAKPLLHVGWPTAAAPL